MKKYVPAALFPQVKERHRNINMKKTKIAVFFGGCSSEYSVSLSSASGVILNLDREKYCPIMIGITKEGLWYYYDGPIDKLLDDTWHSSSHCTPAVLSPNHGEHSLLLLKEEGVERIPFDVAFPVLHGRNGEDGTLQGMLELAGIPLAGCGTLASALCMDKDRAHKLVNLAGVHIPQSMVLEEDTSMDSIESFAAKVGYPLYVKPVKAGSSYGVTKVMEAAQLSEAVSLAFQYDNQAIIEENIDGFEVGCAVVGNRELIIGEVDEIELSGGFFNFTEKYTLKTSSIHVPARISSAKAAEIKEAAACIYKALGCQGFARIDMFLTPKGEIIFNEANTIPGFTEHSRFPSMMKAAGYSFREVLTKIIELAIS